jgi:SAM-dependent methyltransferase
MRRALRVPSEPEHQRIMRVYREYRPTVSQRWRPDNPGNGAILAELERRVESVLREADLVPMTGLKILDVGCGYGHFLALLRGLGAAPSDLHGIDLLPERIELARSRHPDLDFAVGNGEELPYPHEMFDLVLLFSVLTSILDPRVQVNLAAEARRVLRPGGAILWYDLRYDNPWNPHVRGLRRREIRCLFPDLFPALETATLLPPLARRLGRFTPVLYPLLVRLPLLRTHQLGLLRDRRRR